MTIIKQQAVTASSHQKNLRNYINNDEKVLLRDSQNMESCQDLRRWASWMSATRDEFGHNTSSRRGKDGMPAKNTILYHQILAFLPDECDINGGSLKPEDCMSYAKEYAKRFYPNHEIVFALHKEYCKADHTYRYACHMVVNRSDIVTGKRLDEGRGETAKQVRAKRIRSMDEEWNLQQVEEGVVNSTIHKKQLTLEEKGMASRDERYSYKTNLRELCRIAARRSKNIFEYRELLEGWGVETEFRHGKMYATDADHARYSFSIARLDASLNREGLENAFVSNVASSIREKGKSVMAKKEAIEGAKHHIQDIRSAYLDYARKTYLNYRKEANALTGTPLSAFPKLKLKKPPEEIADDPKVRDSVLAYWRGADELRNKLASDVPYTRRNRTTTSGSSTQRQNAKTKQSPEREHLENEKGHR